MLIKKSERHARRGALAATLAAQSSGGVDRRTFLRRSGLAAGSLGVLGALPLGGVRRAEAAGAGPALSSGSARPTFVASGVGGVPSVRFDGVNDFLSLGAGFEDFTAGMTMYVVAQPSALQPSFKMVTLGNGAGKPHDPASQAATLDLALKVLESAPAARTTVQSPQRWSDDPRWKRDFCNVERLSQADRERLHVAHEEHRGIARAVRATVSEGEP